MPRILFVGSPKATGGNPRKQRWQSRVWRPCSHSHPRHRCLRCKAQKCPEVPMSLYGEQTNELKWPRVVRKRGHMMTVVTKWSWHRWHIQACTQDVHTSGKGTVFFSLPLWNSDAQSWLNNTPRWWCAIIYWHIIIISLWWIDDWLIDFLSFPFP